LSERNYRDAVHNIIRLDNSSAEGKLIETLIDTVEFQRLRRIRQLGLAYFAYQSAEHSRFTHSLGAFHLATRTLERLNSKYTISYEHQTAVRVAALLHDIGHGAFSHVIESILGFHHEQFSIDTILSGDTDVGRVLSGFSRELAEDVAGIIRGDFRPLALTQLVSSQLDVDRMDYLLRDSLMSGAKYGIYDLEWIIKSIEIDEANDRLYIAAPGIYAVEDYLQARYYMFRQVYFHRTLRAAEAVLKSLLKRAIDVYAAGGDVWHRTGSAFEKILQKQRLSLSEHLSLDDTDVFFHIKQWQFSADQVLSDLASRFLDRRLFAAFDLDMPADKIHSFVREVEAVVSARGFDIKYYVSEDETGDAAYNFYTTDSADAKNLIFVEDGFARPSVREISEVSSAVRGLQQGYRIDRVCFPAELKDEIAAIYHKP